MSRNPFLPGRKKFDPAPTHISVRGTRTQQRPDNDLSQTHNLLRNRLPLHLRRQMTPTQPDRLTRFVVAESHRLDHVARSVAAGGAGRASRNPYSGVSATAGLPLLPPAALLFQRSPLTSHFSLLTSSAIPPPLAPMADSENPPRSNPLPHPTIMAMRKALAAQPPPSLERVLSQAAASRKFIDEWRAKGLPDLPLPPHLAKLDRGLQIVD
jgi:hypothetical protein